jgi:DNA-binding GntR family transcriptional regulator
MSATFAEAVFAPAVQQALHTQVYDALRRAIGSGSLGPGQRVNEAEIARQMQISRAPVREAIRQLERDGLLMGVPRRGTVVASLCSSEIEELFTLRADLEARAVVRAVGRLSADDLSSLERLAEAMASAAAEADLRRLFDAAVEFHRTIVEAADWPYMQRIWESLHPRTMTPHLVRPLIEWSAQGYVVRHQTILAALRQADARTAAEVMREQVIAVGAEILQCTRAQTAPSDSGARAQPTRALTE